MTIGSQMQAAMFQFLAMQLRKELLFREYLYEKAAFYLNARLEILLRYNATGKSANLKKVIIAQKYVADALKGLKGVEAGLKPNTEVFSSSLFDGSMEDIDLAIDALTGNTTSGYSKRKVSKKKTPQDVIKKFNSNTANIFDNAAQAIKLKALQILIDLKNNIWYVYKVITTLLIDFTILSRSVETAINKLNSAVSLAETSQNIRSHSITGRSIPRASQPNIDGANFRNEPKNWEALDATKGKMAGLKKIKIYSNSRGLFLVNSSIRTWITKLSKFEEWTDDIKSLAKKLLFQVKDLITATDDINTGMLDTIKTPPSSIVIAGKTLVWAGELSVLKLGSMLSSMGAEQEKISGQMAMIKKAAAWFKDYDKNFTKVDINKKTFNIIAKGVGYKGDSLTAMNALGVITDAIGMSFLSRDALKEAIVATKEAIKQCDAAIGENKKILEVINGLDANNNSLVGLLGDLMDAMASAGPPLSEVADLMSSGALDAVGDMINLASTAAGTAEEALDAALPCKANQSAADRREEMWAERKTA